MARSPRSGLCLTQIVIIIVISIFAAPNGCSARPSSLHNSAEDLLRTLHARGWTRSPPRDPQPPLSVTNTFGDHMVLQRNEELRVWGSIQPDYGNLSVTLTHESNGTSIQGAIGASGYLWVAVFPALPEGGPYTLTSILTVTDGTGNPNVTLTTKNIMIGDVFFCSGQSNMQFTEMEAFNASAEIGAAGSYPQIRVMTVGQYNETVAPLVDLGAIEQPWTQASSASIGGPAWKYFSAVCWLYGRNLADSLANNVGPPLPIGLISSNWGGTYIQAWSSPDALGKCPQPSKDPKKAPNIPEVLFNSMVSPFLPMRMKAVLWYQGESNVPALYGGPSYYLCAFPAMINDWREKWNIPNLGFLFVQLAAYINDGGTALASMRTAQMTALKLPGVGMATAIDAGDLASPWNQIHPRNKEIVGSRLLAAAQHYVYGMDNVQYRGPTLTSVASTGNGSMILTYESDPLSPGGLYIKPNVTCPPPGQAKPGVCQAFVILPPGTKTPVQCLTPQYLLISQWKVEVKCPNVAIDTGAVVAYGQSDYPLLSIYNTVAPDSPPSQQWPAQPFTLPVTAPAGEATVVHHIPVRK